MRLFNLICRGTLVAAAIGYGMAQTAVDLRTQSKSVDFSGATSTKPSKTGTSLPSACSIGETFLNIGAATGQNLYVCTTTNGWSAQGAGGTATLGGDASGTPSGLTVIGIQGRPVSATAPSSGQVLTWNAGQWRPYNPAALGGAYAASFTAQTSVTIAGSVHQLNTANLLVTCYDTESPQMEVEPDTISVNASTYDVTVNFAAAQSGRCVVSSGGSGGSSGSGASLSTANTYAPGAKQTMAASATTAGLSVTPGTLPTNPIAGDLAVDATDSNKLKAFNGASWVTGSGPGGGAYASNFTAQTSVTIAGTAHQLNTPNLVVNCYDTETPAMEVDPDTVSVNLTTYDVTINFATAQSGRCVVSSGGSGSGAGSGGSGGGGATMAAQLGDMAVISSDVATLTIGSNCSTTAPCNVRIGNQTYPFTASATVTLTNGTGTAYFYVDANGILTVGHNLALTCTGPCVAVGGVTGFPANSTPLFTWLAANSTWNSAGGTDYRAFLSTQNVTAGTGVSVMSSGSQMVVGVDTAVVPTYVSGSATLNFPSITAGTCAADQTFALPGATPGNAVASGWPALPAGLTGTMWVSASGTLSVRLCNLSGATSSVASSTYTAAVVRSF